MERETWIGYRPKTIIPEKKNAKKIREINKKMERDIKKQYNTGKTIEEDND